MSLGVQNKSEAFPLFVHLPSPHVCAVLHIKPALPRGHTAVPLNGDSNALIHMHSSVLDVAIRALEHATEALGSGEQKPGDIRPLAIAGGVSADDSVVWAANGPRRRLRSASLTQLGSGTTSGPTRWRLRLGMAAAATGGYRQLREADVAQKGHPVVVRHLHGELRRRSRRGRRRGGGPGVGPLQVVGVARAHELPGAGTGDGRQMDLRAMPPRKRSSSDRHRPRPG